MTKEYPVLHPSPAQRFARTVQELSRISGHLRTALAMDGFDAGDRARLTLDDFYTLGRLAGRHGLEVLAATVRLCERCDAPLVSLDDRREGRCQSCRLNRQALRVMQGGRR